MYYNTLLSLVKKKNYEQLKSELETIDKDELKEISDNVNIIKDMQNNDRVIVGQKQIVKNEV